MVNENNICISLNDFESQAIFVTLKQDYKKNLFTNAIIKAGSQGKLSTILKIDGNYPKMKQSTVSFLLKKRTLRLDLVYFLCNYVNIKFDKSQ